jgi:hypothetical protein
VRLGGGAGATAWRFSPAAPPPRGALASGPAGVNVSGVRVDMGPARGAASCRLVFHGGALLPARRAGVAPFGRWIVVRGAGAAVDVVCDGALPLPWHIPARLA